VVAPEEIMGETDPKARARLPSLEVELSHHRSSEGDMEQISIHLRALPSFEAFGDGSINPAAFWALLFPMVWSPWLHASGMLPVWDMTRYLPRGLDEQKRSSSGHVGGG
jgi:hypothetical protein